MRFGITGAASVLLILLSVEAIQAAPKGSSNAITARGGVLNARSYNFKKKEPIELNGQWLIFWKRLLTPKEIAGRSMGELAAASDGVFEIPHTWNDWKYHGRAVGGMGYATFVLDVRLPPTFKEAALWIPDASTAYRLWVNDNLVAQSGTPGRDRRSSKPHYVMNTAEFGVPHGLVRMVLQVSNFHHRRGGMWKPILLGTPEKIRAHDARETAYDLLLLGSFVALAFFNFFLYLNNRHRRVGGDRTVAVPLLLTIIFLALIGRVMVTGQILITRLIPGFPWPLELRIEYLSVQIVFALFAWVSDRSFPGVVPRPVVWGITAVTSAGAFLVLFFRILVYSHAVTTYNIIQGLVLFALLIRFIVWAIQGHKNAWVMVFAILIFFLITFGETLNYREIVLSRDFAPVGFLVTLFTGNSGNDTVAYLVSTMLTLGVILVVFNLFVLRMSFSLLQSEERLTPIDMERMREQFGITARESEILALVAEGKSNKEIGAQLFISEGTVKNHLHRIMPKLGAANRTEIVVRLSR